MLEKIVVPIQRAWRQYRARKEVPNAVEELLGGKKEGWKSSMTLLNGNYATDRDALNAFVEERGTAAAFSAEVEKVGKNKKIVRRTLVLTKDAIYKVDAKYAEKPRRKILLSEIKGIVVSPYKDGIIVIQHKTPGRDALFNLNLGYGLLSEFIGLLKTAFDKKKKRFPFKVSKNITFNGNPVPFTKNPDRSEKRARLIKGPEVLYPAKQAEQGC